MGMSNDLRLRQFSVFAHPEKRTQACTLDHRGKRSQSDGTSPLFSGRPRLRQGGLPLALLVLHRGLPAATLRFCGARLLATMDACGSGEQKKSLPPQ